MRKIKFISILLVLSMLLTVPAFAFSTDSKPRIRTDEAAREKQQLGILRGVLCVLAFR